LARADYTDIETEFNEAMGLMHSGDLNAARTILERLASKRPDAAFVHGQLGHICEKLGELEKAVLCYRNATAANPKSELASVSLFHALNHSSNAREAFAELRRFRSIKHSKEYDLLLIEIQTGILARIQLAPNDPFLTEVRNEIDAELRERPIQN
jgi:predicted Zn-dependent protease